MQQQTKKHINITFFSVVIPVYNKGPHIKRSISSVLNQNYQSFELIVVNDASTDDSVAEVMKFDDQRIRLLHRVEPGPGGYAARNLGIKEAKYNWVAFLDADDEWEKDHLLRMSELANKFDGVNLLSAGWKYGYNSKMCPDKYYSNNYFKGTHLITLEEYLKNSVKGMQPAHTDVVIINKSKMIDYELFPTDKLAVRGGDSIAWLKFLATHKIMLWSSHIGALYHQDSVNMVTKTALNKPYLYSKVSFRSLAITLSQKEKRLLARYFHIKLKNSWIRNIMREQNNFFLFPNLNWRYDFDYALILLFYSIIPESMIIKYINWRVKNEI